MLNYSERIQQSIDFIETNLTTAFTLDDVAKQANFSLFHFHRLFHAFVGLSLKEYIRQRRISEAAEELQSSRNSILDIALLYRYETPESFLRAFKKYYGQTPSEYRKYQRERFLFKKFNLQKRLDLLADGQISFDAVPKFLTLEKLNLAGICLATTDEDEYAAYAAVWNRFYHLLDSETSAGTQLCYGLCQQTGLGQYHYLAGIKQDKLPAQLKRQLTLLQLPSDNWVVFNLQIVPEEIRDAWSYILTRVLPQFNCELAESNEMEIYHRKPDGKINRIDLCIPVKA